MNRLMMRIPILILQIALMVCLCADEPPDLFELVKDGTPEAVQEAIRTGADVNTRNKLCGVQE